MSAAGRVTAAAAVAALVLGGCGSSRKDGGRGALGKATGAAVRGAIDAAAATVEPWRCARLDEPVAVTAPQGWALDGVRLRRVDDGGAAATALRFAVIGEARGAAAPTVTALEGLRRALDAEPVDVVVSLGGMGATRAEIAAALGPVTSGASWLVVAVPGDREAIAEHRAAVAELAAGGAPVVDGSQVRIVEAGGAVIGTLPGARHRERLGAGVAGCVHDDDDVAALLEALRPAPPPDGKDGKDGKAPLTVLVTQQAPRGATDLAPGGVHAGGIGLAAQLAAHPVDLVAHGAVDDGSAPAGKARRGVGAVVPVGAIDAARRYRDDGTPVRPTAVVFTAGARELAWKPVSPRVLP